MPDLIVSDAENNESVPDPKLVPTPLEIIIFPPVNLELPDVKEMAPPKVLVDVPDERLILPPIPDIDDPALSTISPAFPIVDTPVNKDNPPLVPDKPASLDFITMLPLDDRIL